MIKMIQTQKRGGEYLLEIQLIGIFTESSSSLGFRRFLKIFSGPRATQGPERPRATVLDCSGCSGLFWVVLGRSGTFWVAKISRKKNRNKKHLSSAAWRHLAQALVSKQYERCPTPLFHIASSRVGTTLECQIDRVPNSDAMLSPLTQKM